MIRRGSGARPPPGGLFVGAAVLAGVLSAVAARADAPAAAPAADLRSLKALTTTDEPAWPLVQQWIAAAPDVEVLPVDPARADAVLLAMQVTLRAPLGAVAYRTGGLLVDHGWLRILGSGSARMARSLASWNDGRVALDASGRPTMVLVADDVLGGFFALNGGALGTDLGKVYYLAPDTLRWEHLDLGYAEFLAWALSPRLAQFYAGQRWPRWEAEVAKLDGDHALSVTPFLWADGPPIDRRSRKPVAVGELFRMAMEFRLRVSR